MMKPDAPVSRSVLLHTEHRHRRRVLLGLSALLVLAMAPLLGHHLPPGPEASLAGRDHLWALCMAALHVLLTPVHGVFHLLVVAGFVYAVFDRADAWRRQRAVLALLPAETPATHGGFRRAARAVGLDPDRLRIVVGLPSPAFTVGWLRPVVYADARLSTHLSAEELQAVLAHEAAHVRRMDPLRLSALRFLACTLFWLTAVRGLVDDLVDDAEVVADDAAVRGRPLVLASALLKLAQWGLKSPRAVGVGFADRDMLTRRVKRLAGEPLAPQTRLTRRSIATALLALTLAWAAGFVAARPLAAEDTSTTGHCQHEGFAALFHLYCPGYAAHRSRADCPHR